MSILYICYSLSPASQDLDDKYGDDEAVKDLIARKTALRQFEDNPDFPNREDQHFTWEMFEVSRSSLKKYLVK